MSILILNNSLADMFPDTEVSGAYKPISLDSDVSVSNPHTYEFQIPLTDNNKRIIEFNDDTLQFKQKGIKAQIRRDDNTVILSGYAYISMVTINKLETSVSVQVVDIMTYLIKEGKNVKIGDMFKGTSLESVRYSSFRGIRESSNNHYKYVYTDCTGFNSIKSENGDTDYVFIGNVNNEAQIPLAVNPINIISEFCNKHMGNINLDISNLDETITGGTLSTIIPVKRLVSVRDLGSTLPVRMLVNGRFLSHANVNGAAYSENSSIKAMRDVFGIGFKLCRSSLNQEMYIYPVNLGEKGTSGFYYSTNSNFNRSCVYDTIVSIHNFRFKLGFESQAFDGVYRLKIRGVDAKYMSGAKMSIIMSVGDSKFEVASGVVSLNNDIVFKTVDIDILNNYIDIIEIKNGLPYEFAFEIVANTRLDITDASNNKYKWLGSEIQADSSMLSDDAIPFEIVKKDGSLTAYDFTISNVQEDEGTGNGLTLNGCIYAKDRLLGLHGIHANVQNALNDEYAIDIAETLNSSGITMDSFIKDFINRFNISIINDEGFIEMSHVAGKDSHYDVIIYQSDVNSQIDITRNEDESTIKSIQLSNTDYGLKYDKYNDNTVLGSSDEIVINEDAKDKKVTQLNSSIVPVRMYGDYNTVDDNTAESINKYGSQISLGITPYKPYSREKYGIRYGFEKPKYDNDSSSRVQFLQLEPLIRASSYITTSIGNPNGTRIPEHITYAPYLYAFAKTMTNKSMGFMSTTSIQFSNGVTQNVRVFEDKGVLIFRDLNLPSGTSYFRIINNQALTLYRIATNVSGKMLSINYYRVTEYNLQTGGSNDTVYYDRTGTYTLLIPMREVSSQSTFIYNPPVRINDTLDYINRNINVLDDSVYRTDGVRQLLSFNKRINGFNSVTAMDTYFNKVSSGIYNRNALFIEGDFYISPDNMCYILTGSSVMFNGKRYGVVEVNEIDYTSSNGCIVKLKLFKI